MTVFTGQALKPLSTEEKKKGVHAKSASAIGWRYGTFGLVRPGILINRCVLAR